MNRSETFIEKSKIIHNNKYIYNDVSYINTRTKVTIICPIHDSFEILPHNHIAGQGCPKCSRDRHKLTIISNDRLEILKKIHNNKYIYEDLTISNGKIKIFCIIHGEFAQSIYNHEKGHGCSKCDINNRKVMKYRNCTQCNNYKDLSSFNKNQRRCNECLNTIITNKICSKCNIDKPIELFYIRKKDPLTYRNECIECFNKKDYNKKYREKNKDTLREKRKEYHKNRLEKDNFYKCKISIRNLIRKSIVKNGFSKNSKTQEILGCSYQEFKEYLESKFQPDMNWNNRNLWHIDHILCLDFAINEEELLSLNQYTNLQPLWIQDNLNKSNLIIKNDLYYKILRNRYE